MKGQLSVNNNRINGTFTGGGAGVINGSASSNYRERLPAYAGPYEVTPTQETQVLQTDRLRMTSDVVVNPIPSNYGLITWNGSVLTVS